jgi:hypothetical protein
LKNALERQQGKGAPANAITTQSFEDLKNHPCLQQDLANAERTSSGATPQATFAILHHQTSGLKKPALDDE